MGLSRRSKSALLALLSIVFVFSPGAFGPSSAYATPPPVTEPVPAPSETAAPAAAGTGSPVSFSVGLRNDPLVLRAGESAQRTAAITNTGAAATTFTVGVISVDVGDDGKVNPAEGRRDLILDTVTVQPTVTVEAGATVNVGVSVSMTDLFSPDIYFAGILVEPVPSQSTGTVTLTRLINVLAIDVVGEQTRGVEITFLGTKSFVIGSEISGTYRIFNRNAGVSLTRLVTVNGTVVNNPSAVGSDGVQTLSRDTIARGHYKTFSYTYEADTFAVQRVRPTVEATFDDNGSDRTESEVGPSTVLITPAVLATVVALVALVLLLVIAALVRRRKRRRSVAAAPLATELPPEIVTELPPETEVETPDVAVPEDEGPAVVATRTPSESPVGDGPPHALNDYKRRKKRKRH